VTTFGEELRRQRELRQISLEEIADATKVNVRFLAALERNEFASLPGGLFTKGFIRAYAGHVGLDQDATVNAYLYQVERDEEEKARREARRDPHQPRLERTPDPAPQRRIVPLVGGLAGLALLIALVAWFAGTRGASQTEDGAPEESEENKESTMQPTHHPDPAPDPVPLSGDESDGSELPVGTAVETGTGKGTEHVLEIVATRSEMLRIACDEVNLLERLVERGEQLTRRCEGAFRLSAARAGSFRARLDGAAIALPGSALRDWVVAAPAEAP
jgi:cytoskeletal protein RodZ